MISLKDMLDLLIVFFLFLAVVVDDLGCSSYETFNRNGLQENGKVSSEPGQRTIL